LVPELLDLQAPLPVYALTQTGQHLSRLNVRGAHPSPNVNMYSLEPSQTGYEPASIGRFWRALYPNSPDPYRRILTQTAVSKESALGNRLLSRPFWLVPYWIQGSIRDARDDWRPTLYTYIEDDRPQRVQSVNASNLDDLHKAFPERVRSIGPIGNGTRTFRGRIPEYQSRSTLRVHYEASGNGEIQSEFTGGRTRGFGHAWRIEPTREISFVDIALPDDAEGELVLEPIMDSPDAVCLIHAVDLISDGWDENDRIEIAEWTANTVEVNVTVPSKDSLLVFTDAGFPGWQAVVDDKRVPIYRANGAFKAVEVPAGSHRVRFAFQPVSVQLGGAVSLVAWGAGLTFLVVSAGRYRTGGRSGRRKTGVDRALPIIPSRGGWRRWAGRFRRSA
jgi:hypothetical protein